MIRRDGSIPVLVLGSLLALVNGKAIDIFDMTSLEPIEPNYCNNSEILEQAGLYKSTLGQFLGFECSQEFYHCRWQSDGFRTYRKACKTGLVYDTFGTQNCNYDYNVKGCSLGSGTLGDNSCNTTTSFWCPLSEQCVEFHKRCDGIYDCSLEEDEQNCPLCSAGEFACIVSEECVPIDRRCNGMAECTDGTDERDCDICGHGLFHCGKSNECVPLEHRCDGHRDCRHGEDEMLCRTKPLEKAQFTCESRQETIPMRNVCDGELNCADGSDEKYCEVPGVPQPSVILSSNPRQPQVAQPPAPMPSQYLPAVQPQPQPAEEETIYQEYETPDDEKADYQAEKAAFPMFSIPPLPVLPKKQTTQRQTTTQRPTRVFATTPRPTPAVFSRPKPRILPPQPRVKTQMIASTPAKVVFVQPTFVEVTAPPVVATSMEYSTEEDTTVVIKTRPTRRPLGVKNGKRTKSGRTRTTTPAAGMPKNQDVVQVTRLPPQLKNPPLGQRYPVGTVDKNERVTAPPDEYGDFALQTSTRSPHKLIQQISTHLQRNGRSEATVDILHKIEEMLTTELGTQPTEATIRTKKNSRRPNRISPTLEQTAASQRFVSRVTRPARYYEVSHSMFN